MRSLLAGVMGEALPYSAPIWIDPSDLRTMFQERTGASASTPAGPGDAVGSIRNRGTLGGWLTAPDDGSKPLLIQSGALYYLHAPTGGYRLDFASAHNAVFTGQRFYLLVAAYFDVSGTILGGTGSSTNENLHAGHANAGLRFGMNSNAIESASAYRDQALVMTGLLGAAGKSLRANGAQVASDSNTDTLSNGGLRLFSGPLLQDADEVRFYGLVARPEATTSASRRNRDEQYLAGKAGISFTSS